MSLDIENLSWAAGSSRHVDWREALGEDMDGYVYAEAFTYDLDRGEAGNLPLTLVAINNTTAFVAWDGKLYDVRPGYEGWASYTEYLEQEVPGEHGGSEWEMPEDALTEDEFNELADVEPSMHGSEGPMMNTFWGLDSGFVSDDHESLAEAAYKIRDVPMCVVMFEDTDIGLALTGGGMDLSWEIAEAYIRLGTYPPNAIDRMPADASGLSDTRRAILTALTEREKRNIMLAERNIVDYERMLGKE